MFLYPPLMHYFEPPSLYQLMYEAKTGEQHKSGLLANSEM